MFQNQQAQLISLVPKYLISGGADKLLYLDCGDDKEVEIKEQGGEIIIQERQMGPKMVDLGLTSGTLWAKCNIGAASETAAGKYYAWGDAEGFEASEVSGKFSESWYNDRPGKSLTGNIADNDATHNAAYAAYGAGYTMPSQADFNELINGTNHSWTTVSGVNGHKFTNKSDATKYIFIPAAGLGFDGSISRVGDLGVVWSSDINSDEPYYAYFMGFKGDGSIFVGNEDDRFGGYSVRAIKRNS